MLKLARRSLSKLGSTDNPSNDLMTDRRMRAATKRRGRGRAAGLLFAILALGISAYWLLSAPRVTSIDPIAFAPGGTITIQGKNFGKSRGGSRVLLDSTPLTQSSYISWSSKKIELLLPLSLDSGILQVATPFGTSNPDIVISTANLPAKPENSSQAASGPAIRTISPAEAEIGSIVEIEGINFGSNVQFSRVRFSRNTAGKDPGSLIDSEKAAGMPMDSSFIEPEDPLSMYESWDDKRISVRVPEGAGSGAIIVSTPQGDSEPFTFSVKQGSGAKYLFDPAVYSLTFKVRIRRQKPNQAGTLVLYMPNPPSTFSQNLDGIQEETPAPFMSDYGRVAVVKLSDIPGTDTTVTRTVLVTIHSVETDLSGYKDSFPGGRIPNFLQPYMNDDSLVPSSAKDIASLAAKIVGKERNLQKRASLIASWLAKNLRWKPRSDARDTPQGALKEGLAGTRVYALLSAALFRSAGLPAVPISGFLARKDNVSIPHFWMEYYLPAVGWIPFDPVLALGSRPSGFDAGLDDPSHYFGALDNRHIALSRGLTNVAPLLGGSDMQRAKAPWSFQTLFEESLGAAYASSWQEIEITGVF